MNLAKFKNGLWRVDCGSFCAGFVVSNGHLTCIAPCLRKNFDVFVKFATWICFCLALICSALAASITLAWDASPDALSYNLYVGIQSIRAGNPPIIFYPTTFTQLQVDGLDYGTEYFFVVTALANGLESEYSNEVQYTPVPLATPTPTPLATPGHWWKK